MRRVEVDGIATVYNVHVYKGNCEPRSFKVTPTAPIGGGTQLYEGAHLTGAIRAFVANQANVAIMGFLLL